MRSFIIVITCLSVSLCAMDDLSDEEFTKQLEQYQKSDKFQKEVPSSLRDSFIKGLLRVRNIEKIVRIFLKSDDIDRSKWGTHVACDTIREQGPFEILKDSSWQSQTKELPKNSTAEESVKAIFEATTYLATLILQNKKSNEVARYMIKIEVTDDKPLITDISKDKIFDSVKWLVEKQDLAVHEFLRELIAKPHETRDLASIELERLLPAEKLFFYKASNVKGELATAEHEVIYAVTIKLDVPVDAKPAAVFLFIGIKKVDEKWVISSVAEDARKKADFQKNIVIADFIWCYIKATPKERSKMQINDVKSKLPETGVLTLDSNRKQIDPFAVCSLEDAKWTIRVALTHSERFGHIQKNRIWFKFFVSENAKGALKVYEEQMQH